MSLLYAAPARATVAAGARAVTVTGLDLTNVRAGMTLHFGSFRRVSGDGYIIEAVAPDGTGGGTLTTADAVASAQAAVPFVIDTREFNGNASFYLLATTTNLVNTLTRLLGPSINLFSDSREIALDKVSAPAASRLLFSIANRLWAALDHRSLTYTPSGKAAVATEALAVRAYPDGATAVDALVVDLKTGGVDAMSDQVVMEAAGTIDLASAPARRVIIGGTAVTTSFGAGRRKSRIVRVANTGLVFKHGPNLVLPGEADITARAGDTLFAESDENGAWVVYAYQRADGTAISAGATVRYDAAQVLTPAQRSTVRASIGAAGLSALAGKNLLVNSGMAISQEWGSTGATGQTGYGVDQWPFVVAAIPGAQVVAERVASPFPTQPSIPFGMQLRVLSAAANLGADAAFMLYQTIEGQRLKDLLYGTSNSQPLTVFGFVRANFTGRIGISIVNGGVYLRGLDVNNASDLFFRMVFVPRGEALPLDNLGRFSLRIGLAAGSNRRGSENLGNSGNVVDAIQPVDGTNMLQVQDMAIRFSALCALPGDVDVTAETAALFLRSQAEEIPLCQRYYAKSYPLDVVPGTPGFNGAHRGIVSATNGRTGLSLPLPVTMRTAPSVVLYSTSGTAGSVLCEDGNGDRGVDLPAVIAGGSSPRLAGAVNLTALTAGDPAITMLGRSVVGHFTANARMS